MVQWAAFATFSVAVLGMAVWLAGDFGEARAHAVLKGQAAGAVVLNTTVLRSELERQRSLPFVLAQDPDVQAALTNRTAGRLTALDKKLERLSTGTHAAVIYLLDADGRAIAASNWRKPASPVGSDYKFRSYFRRAVRDGAAEYFALGTLTRRPGLYISRRVRGADTSQGVIVVKVQFDQVEHEWQRSGTNAYVTNPQGIVIVASNPKWHFMRDIPIDPRKAAEIRASRQFGKAPLDPLPLHVLREGNSGGDLVRLGQTSAFLAAAGAIPTTDWQMHVLLPAEGLLNAEARNARSTAILALMPLLVLAGILLYRRQRARIREAEEIAARAELESRVEIRTAELRMINHQLSTEMDERQKAESRLQTARDELVQANRLAVLGQITAGVAHEVNQPVAAIRSYADNAAALLDRGDGGAVKENLASIADLTKRIGGITQELRAFSRKGTDEIGPTSLADVVDGALLVLGGRIREQGVAFDYETPRPDLKAYGKLIRLEQVLVNLLQNALEVLSGRADGRIRIATTIDGEQVRLSVEDNGPGIASDVAEGLFIPFNTSKPRGLGLGLVISKDIVAEFGGRLELTRTGETGTLFTIYLRRAP